VPEFTIPILVQVTVSSYIILSSEKDRSMATGKLQKELQTLNMWF